MLRSRYTAVCKVGYHSSCRCPCCCSCCCWWWWWRWLWWSWWRSFTVAMSCSSWAQHQVCIWEWFLFAYRNGQLQGFVFASFLPLKTKIFNVFCQDFDVKAMLCEFDPCRRLFVACQTHSVQKSRTNHWRYVRCLEVKRCLALRLCLADILMSWHVLGIFWLGASGALVIWRLVKWCIWSRIIGHVVPSHEMGIRPSNCQPPRSWRSH